eukprot:5218463-Lingulodinium_polyedra.AAC.1
MAVPASGDGIAYVCRALLEDSDPEEPTVIIAVDAPGSMVQRLLEAVRAAEACCRLTVFGYDDTPEAWYGRAHTSTISA